MLLSVACSVILHKFLQGVSPFGDSSESKMQVKRQKYTPKSLGFRGIYQFVIPFLFPVACKAVQLYDAPCVAVNRCKWF